MADAPYFPDGFYTFYSTGEEGKRAASAELAIFNDELGYPSDEDKAKIGDIFPEGPIGFRTRTQIEKFLHDQHGYAHLEYSGSGLDHPGAEVESKDEGSEETPGPDQVGSEGSPGPTDGDVADDADASLPQ